MKALGFAVATALLTSITDAPPAQTMAKGEGRKRRAACNLIKHAGLTHKSACAKVGLSYSTFKCGKWYKKFLEGGEEAVEEDLPRNKRRKVTPQTEKFIISMSKDKKLSQKEIVRMSYCQNPGSSSSFPANFRQSQGRRTHLRRMG